MEQFVAIDFETANSKRSSACALGIAVVSDNALIDSGSWLIRPRELYFDPFNTWIHGITEEDVRDKPEFNELWDEFSSHFEGGSLVAHNASFDLSVLRHVLDLYGLDYPQLDYLCSRVIAKRVWPGLVNYGLDTVCNHLGISFKHDDAREDAMASARVIISACGRIEATTLEELAVRVGIAKGQLYPGAYKPCGLPQNYFQPDSLVPSTTHFRVEHPFFDKLVVFTGTLQAMVRRDAVQHVVDLGGHCSNSVTRTTNYLVVGDPDFAKLRGASKSSKLRKAESLTHAGFDLEIIRESEFLAMLDS